MRLVTMRTEQAAIWMVPSEQTNELLGSILARYQEICGIVIYAYSFLGNHFHLLVKAPNGGLDEFMQNVNREIAKRINRCHGRIGKFWGERYDAPDVIEEGGEISAFLYVVTNPTKHGLIDHPQRWPGLHSYQHILSEEDRTFEFVEGRRGKRIRTPHTLVLSPLPQFASHSKEERRKIVNELMNQKILDLRIARKAAKLGFLTASQILRQTPGAIPRQVSRRPRSRIYSSNPETRRQALESRRLLERHYSLASVQFRGGDLHAVFPAFTFRPPLHRKPRVIPFGHLLLANVA